MNVTPTSGPIANSSTHHARDDTSSRYSLSSRCAKGAKEAKDAKTELFLVLLAISALLASCERKEHLFQIGGRNAVRRRHRGQLVERPFAADPPAAQEHEAIADARRVGDLVDRQHERAARRRVRAQNARHVAALTQVQAVERFVGEED